MNAIIKKAVDVDELKEARKAYKKIVKNKDEMIDLYKTFKDDLVKMYDENADADLIKSKILLIQNIVGLDVNIAKVKQDRTEIERQLADLEKEIKG